MTVERQENPLIVFIATTLNQRSGAGRRTTAVVRACITAGFRVCVVCGPSHDLDAESARDFDLRVIATLGKRIDPWGDLKALLELRELLRDRLQI